MDGVVPVAMELITAEIHLGDGETEDGPMIPKDYHNTIQYRYFARSSVGITSHGTASV